MVDKGSGQGGSDQSIVHVNLLENDKAVVSVGEIFSTNGGILGERERKKFDDAVVAFKKKYDADVKRGIDAYIAMMSAPMPY
jgi:hypothetical protein